VTNPAISLKPGDLIVEVDPRYFRPSEVETLLGDSSVAKKELGWEPQISFRQMIQEMIEHDLESARRHALLLSHGFKVSLPGE
jgi:GDPmannose 4,6-dehydratase